MRFFFMLLVFTSQLAAADLVVYTDRPSARLAEAASQFKAATGQEAILVEAAYKDLLARLELEKSNPVADVFITKDIVYLNDIAQKGLLQPMATSAAVSRVPSTMRDPQGLWTALTWRARTAVYKVGKVNPDELTTYEDLATEKWAGRLCVRRSGDAYNQALLADLISRFELAKATEIVKGWVANLDNPVYPGDRDMLAAILSGDCDVAVVNHYYLAEAIQKARDEGRPYEVGLKFLNQGQGGVHINGAGIGIVNTSTQAALAQTFIDIMLSDAVLQNFSKAHFDYPAVLGLAPTSLIAEWGMPEVNPIPWSVIAGNLAKVKELTDSAGYN